MENKSVYLVTGSDKETIEQIGTEIWSKVKKVISLVEMLFTKKEI